MGLYKLVPRCLHCHRLLIWLNSGELSFQSFLHEMIIRLLLLPFLGCNREAILLYNFLPYNNEVRWPQSKLLQSTLFLTEPTMNNGDLKSPAFILRDSPTCVWHPVYFQPQTHTHSLWQAAKEQLRAMKGPRKFVLFCFDKCYFFHWLSKYTF